MWKPIVELRFKSRNYEKRQLKKVNGIMFHTFVLALAYPLASGYLLILDKIRRF